MIPPKTTVQVTIGSIAVLVPSSRTSCYSVAVVAAAESVTNYRRVHRSTVVAVAAEIVLRFQTWIVLPLALRQRDWLFVAVLVVELMSRRVRLSFAVYLSRIALLLIAGRVAALKSQRSLHQQASVVLRRSSTLFWSCREILEEMG